MLMTFALGVALNLTIVILNYVLYLSPRGKRFRNLLYCAPFVLPAVAVSIFSGILAYRGLSTSEVMGYRLSLVTLLLAAPLIVLVRRKSP